MIRLSGRLRSALIIGGQGIRSRKLRTFLSMISLFLGVLAVVTVQAGAETAKTLRLADLELHVGKDGTRQMYIPPMPDAMDAALTTVMGKPGAVGMLGYQAIIGEPDVLPINQGAAPFDNNEGGYYGPAMPMNCDPMTGMCRPMEPVAQPPRGQAIEVVLQGLTGDVRQFRPFRPVSGDWLDFGGDPSYSPRLVINKEAAKGFTRYQIPAEMRVEGATANPTPRIIGVVDDGNPQPTAYVRADEMRNWMPKPSANQMYGPGLQLLFAPGAGETEALVTRKLTGLGVPQEMLHVETINARKDIAGELAIIRWIFLGMAALVLLIGVAGILNVGLATVGERVEEFALRRAVGTPRSLLAGIVLAETLLTGLLTAAAAIGLAVVALDVGAGLLGSRVPQLQEMTFPWQAGVAGVIAGLVAGLLGGLIPAIRAARIPIATVMRA
ncbi:FtsX-like permease family protein [Dactylosporangium sp. NPDC049742]|uniref:ABC transporter permease n=1 Tax=Dactylosporangium sp. NPDC049742 TaxID=3154737 RepID=UPI00342D3C5E